MVPVTFALIFLLYKRVLTEVCIKSVFLHSLEPLNPSSKLFCVVRRNVSLTTVSVKENVLGVSNNAFITSSRFEKYVPARYTPVSSSQVGTIEILDDDNDQAVVAFQYPVSVLSDQCSGTAPLSYSENISTICYPSWPSFDEVQCKKLKYLNASYYLHKYIIQKDGNKTVVAMEATPETNPSIRWSRWDGTACTNAVIKVMNLDSFQVTL
ncbi:unnamed protein product [Gongylonema pulchrum]|uniref:DUF1619 domain-containing protein n=1 Tax=Gongylonema pulchrum TaxID=637853 RepID=A0A183D1S8_9BILA|nr:unnamed protein product [Gongylonema pulchrum]